MNKILLSLILCCLVGTADVRAQRFGQWEDISPAGAEEILLFGLRFYDDDLGIAVGQNTSSGTGFIVRTTDGGANWSVGSIPNAHLRDVDYFNRDDILIGGYDGPPGTKTLFVTSTSAGDDWNISETSGVKGINNIDIVNEDVAYTLGYGDPFGFTTSVLTTTDRGENWSVALAQGNLYGVALQFIDPLVGFFGATDFNKGFLYLTTDGGSAWNTIEFNEWTEDISFLDSYVGFVLAQEKLYRTVDGGISWTSTSVNELHARILFLDNMNGIAVGESGQSEYTDDGGETWNALATGVQVNLESLSRQGDFIYASGRGGTVLRLDLNDAPEDVVTIDSDLADDKLDFGSVAASESAMIELGISNTGTAPLIISQIALQSEFAGVFALVNPPALPLELLPGQSMKLSVVFNPGEDGKVYTGELIISSNADNEANFAIALSGIGGTPSSVGSRFEGPELSMALQLSPNPVRERAQVTLDVTTLRADDIELLLLDLHGRPLRSFVRPSVTSGRHHFDIELGDLAAGRYYLLAQFAGRSVQTPLLLIP